MNKSIKAFLASAAVLSLTACTSAPASSAAPATSSASEATAEDGTYTAPVRGFYGDFEVTVTIADGVITDVKASENMESPMLGGFAIEMINEAIKEKGTVGVDSVSGATLTSNAYKAGIKEALKQANAPESFFAAAEYEQTNEEYKTDVLVIGAGAAGYAAAVAAAEGGADVILIEKQDVTGGSCVTSAGIVYAAMDEADVPAMKEYYKMRAEGKGDEAIIDTYVEGSMGTKTWLEEHGVMWMFNAPAGTAPEPRANFAMGITGESLIGPLMTAADAAGVLTLTDCAAYELTTDADGKVTGAKARGKHSEYTFEAGAVVLAAGGFDADEGDKAEWSPIAVGDFPLSSKGNTGDGIEMGMAVGAATEFKAGIIGFMFCNPVLPASGNSGSVLTAPAYVDGEGAFVAKGIDYPINYTALKAYGGKTFFALWAADGEGSAQSAVDQGHGFRADTVADLAAAMGADAEKLQASFDEAGLDTTAGPLFAIEAQTTTIGSMGGLVINTDAEVLSTEGTPIAGLYAAGEVCNPGLYYIEYPASGTSNSASFTYGRIAAANALKYLGK